MLPDWASPADEPCSDWRSGRRQWMQTLAGAWLLPESCMAEEVSAKHFDFSSVKQLAHDLAQRPFVEPSPLPPAIRDFTYDQYRLIAFRHERALWRKESLPFFVEFHHRGFVHKESVQIHLVEDGKARPFAFDPNLFQYRGELASLKTSPDWGYAGFRLLYRLPFRTHEQEFCSFLGASYFRAICTSQVYGASARGIAIDTGLPTPEEFPRFRTFWIERPTVQAHSIRVWALLDGPSVTGAYEFRITPGLLQSTLDIDCQLHFRRAVKKLGIAPMSSMWAWGSGEMHGSDPRPEVHDSDGLLIHSSKGEWLWRPLARRSQVSVSQFQFDGLKGFGLMQRDRHYDHYRDDEAKYHLRPSIWIKPRESWGAGTVELLELPTADETSDNVAAYWVPKQPARKGDTLSLQYRVAFAQVEPEEHGGGRFLTTQVNRSEKHDVQFTLTADSPELRSLDAEKKPEAVVTCNPGKIADIACSKLPSGHWRIRFQLKREEDRPVELRAFLRRENHTLSETWSYLCS